ncbi:MAG: antibiotic biosynthesis monooxygenase [Caldilineaceae bacterium]
MIAVIFEVWPHEDCRDAYLQLAATLRPRLAEIDGFISVERFQSISDPGKLLSLSIWRDEAAVEQWRRVEMHRTAQHDGREWIFREYRLRVAGVIRDYGMLEREQAPADSQAIHQPK